MSAQRRHCRVSSLLFIGLTAGCEPSADPVLEELLASCAGHTGMAWDFCAHQLVEQNVPQLNGELGLKACALMTDLDARDLCIEVSMRMPEPYAPESACKKIRGEQLQISCFLGAADRDLRAYAQDGTIAQAHARCLEVEPPVKPHCIAHIVDSWEFRWVQANSVQAFRDDVAWLAEQGGTEEELIQLGSAAGSLAGRVGIPYTDLRPCNAFVHESDPKKACHREHAQVSGLGIQQGPPNGG